MDLAIRRHDAEPELAGIDAGERRDIGRDLAALIGAAHLLGDVADQPPDIRHAFSPRPFRPGATAKPQPALAVKRRAKAVAANAKLR